MTGHMYVARDVSVSAGSPDSGYYEGVEGIPSIYDGGTHRVYLV